MKISAPRNLERRKTMLRFVYDYTAKAGEPPTVREIGKASSLSSISTTAGYLNRMVNAGLLTRNPHRERKYCVTKAGEYYLQETA